MDSTELYLVLFEVCELCRPRLLYFGLLGKWWCTVHKPSSLFPLIPFSLFPFFPFTVKGPRVLTSDILHQVPQRHRRKRKERGRLGGDTGERDPRTLLVCGTVVRILFWQAKLPSTPPATPLQFPRVSPSQAHSRQNSPPAKRIRYRPV